MPPTRVPWIRVDVDLDQSDKVGALAGGDARWGWVRTLLRAKTQRRMGIFGSRRHLAELLGAEGKHVPAFVRVGLAHEVPADPTAPWGCDSPDDPERCRRWYPDAKPGEVVIHDFRKEQRDPTAADRKAAERSGMSRDGHGDVTAMSRRSHGQTGPDVTAKSRDGHGDVTTDSRARGETVTMTVTRDVLEVPLNPEPPARARARGTPPTSGGNGSPVRLTAEQRAAWRDFGPEWDGFREAWTARGFRLPPTGGADEDDGPEQSQRRMLATVVDGWPGSVGAWVREAPPGAPAHAVVGHVLQRYREAIADRQARADADEVAWAADKAAERQRASAVLDELDFGGEAA